MVVYVNALRPQLSHLHYSPTVEPDSRLLARCTKHGLSMHQRSNFARQSFALCGMADDHGASHIDSSPDVETPAGQSINPSILSPPDFPHRTMLLMPTSAPGTAASNSNGKRPLNTISNGLDEVIDLTGSTDPDTSLKPRQDYPPQHSPRKWVHLDQERGRAGHAWLNKHFRAFVDNAKPSPQLLHAPLHMANDYAWHLPILTRMYWWSRYAKPNHSRLRPAFNDDLSLPLIPGSSLDHKLATNLPHRAMQ
ncbi:hypothetical protein LTR48_003459 [Friedmanniomyces endolithicus]|uniref:Uncharacterized protein n=1 Tax=Rachicladosporium monterosium TaxID=1507873 RepID=A0ABR0LBB4_9PEZI|nr:hypothetical protein LTR48_003459 [Friedmanniomyces endolithicus]KAK5146254.1 hypothetical protein LTR32_002132 [Rachicladosporium monterosium]